MADSAKKKATYEDLYQIPENMVGEIIDGQVIVTPRPSAEHSLASSCLGAELIPPFYFARGGGPGGWVILDEPEVEFGENILVPDLAGWRKERFARSKTNWISVVPDWVCEILSPSTLRLDRIKKLSLYGRHRVQYSWLIDPIARTLEVFRLESGKWVLVGAFSEADKVRAEPFQEVEISLSNLWLEDTSGIGGAS